MWKHSSYLYKSFLSDLFTACFLLKLLQNPDLRYIFMSADKKRDIISKSSHTVSRLFLWWFFFGTGGVFRAQCNYFGPSTKEVLKLRLEFAVGTWNSLYLELLTLSYSVETNKGTCLFSIIFSIEHRPSRVTYEISCKFKEKLWGSFWYWISQFIML